jgi:ribosome maturation protein SDO1
MSDKFNIARIKKMGQTFEICIDTNKAIEFKKGQITDLREVLEADQIFTDAQRGLVAPAESLARAFQTTEFEKIARIILENGEIQLSSEHRAKERDQKLRQLVHMIHIQAVNPATNLPHPVTRIEAALQEAKIHLDEHKKVEEQFDEIISKLRPIIPLKIEQKTLIVTIAGQYVGKANQIVRSKKLISEDWKGDGSWQACVEMPAGLVEEFMDKLNSITHGDVGIEVKD